MGHVVEYEENEPPAAEPGFDFTNFIYPKVDSGQQRVVQQTNLEARHLWKIGERYSKRYRCAVDVGANVGAMTYALALLYNKVIAFEPWLESFDCLESNSVHFPPCDIVMRTEAVGAVNEPSVMYSAHLSRRDAHLKDSPKGERGTPQNVSVVRLDDVITEPVDLLKVDVEGTELDVLAGAERLIREWKPLIYIEIKRQVLHESNAALEALGYTEIAHSGHNYVFGEK